MAIKPGENKKMTKVELSEEEINIIIHSLKHCLVPFEEGWILKSRQRYREIIEKLNKGEKENIDNR